MFAATITKAQDKGLRHHLGAALGTVRSFAAGMYAAHGGWTVAQARSLNRRASLMALAAQSQAHSPNLANELRNFASRG